MLAIAAFSLLLFNPYTQMPESLYLKVPALLLLWVAMAQIYYFVRAAEKRAER